MEGLRLTCLEIWPGMFLKAAKAKDIDPTEEFLRMAAYIYSDKCAESLSLALANQLREMQIWKMMN